MKTHAVIRIVPLLALAAGPFFALAACEGEPPVMAPENPSGPTADVAATPAPAMSEAKTEEAASPVRTAARPSAPPCAPPAPAVLASAAPSASGAPEPVSSTPAVPAPSETHGDIVGVVTTKPKALEGYAVVYLEDGPKEETAAPPKTVRIENRQMTFVPFVSVAAAGTKVVFTNADPFPHNVFSPDRDKFNMGSIPQNGARARVFEEPGAYSLLCNLHPGMIGYLLVTPSAWFARTDAKGHFSIKGVPSGTYRLTAWAPRQAPATQSVTVAGDEATVNFDLHR